MKKIKKKNDLQIGKKVVGKTVYGKFLSGEVVNILENTIIVQRDVKLEVMLKKEVIYFI